MQKVILVPLLVLGWTSTLEGLLVLPEPLYATQENFDLAQFLGTWHDVAIASTCPHMQRHRGDAAIGKLVLQRGTSEDKLKMKRTVLRHGTCKEISGEYELTTTPGRFFYHVERYGSDVDAYVVHTNYNEYAIVIMSKQKSSREKSISLKLYSRTMAVRPTVLEDFKTLVRQEGMSADTIIIKQDKGDCVPGEVVAEPSAQPEPEPQRVRRTLIPVMVAAEEEGSADDSPLFNGTEACQAEPDTGPCFGLHQRYYYNASSLSCAIFKYGGCLGNQNNFQSERECLQRCRTEAVCRLPLAAEPCTGQPPIWSFDSTIGLCVPYKQGFCQTNANKFYSKAECEEYCGVVKDDGELLNTN
ncbi:protein AMBP-like [Seriola lalandi dorsalis]|uniref:Protein AMBP n=1 Tax=Seriola lalandi dorsalis TaxID=1841481 RepID=A0A3B4WN29_SERLL|nr:protein AMBP-like [Seriola lalandi dorsalis]XP_056260331.1 protein AMBP [Seriola aureovittata]